MGGSKSKPSSPVEYTGGLGTIHTNGFSPSAGGSLNKPKLPLPDHEEIEMKFAVILVSIPV